MDKRKENIALNWFLKVFFTQQSVFFKVLFLYAKCWFLPQFSFVQNAFQLCIYKKEYIKNTSMQTVQVQTFHKEVILMLLVQEVVCDIFYLNPLSYIYLYEI